jgi:hypothetical protein
MNETTRGIYRFLYAILQTRVNGDAFTWQEFHCTLLPGKHLRAFHIFPLITGRIQQEVPPNHD